MKYYFYVKQSSIIGSGQAKCSDCECVEVSKEIFEEHNIHTNKFIINNGEVVLNPNFEKEEEVKAKIAENEALKARLDELDIKAVRPLRAIISGEATDADRNKIVDLENEAQSIRAKITENNSIINNGGINE